MAPPDGPTTTGSASVPARRGDPVDLHPREPCRCAPGLAGGGVLALCLALRSSEVSSLDDHSFAHDEAVSFKRAKCWRETSATRQLPEFAWGWARWFRTLRKVVEVDPVRAYHGVRERSGLPYTPFHGLRRATARALFSAGVSVSKILWWCRRKHPKMLKTYLGHSFIPQSLESLSTALGPDRIRTKKRKQ